MNNALIVGLDIGTSGVRAVAYSASGDAAAEGRARLKVDYPQSGRAEQSPDAWWTGSAEALRLMSLRLGEDVRRVACIGLTGHCPSFALLDRSGTTSGSGWLYQDNRALAESERIVRMFGKDAIHRRTGQAPSPFYVAPKLLWLYNHGGPGNGPMPGSAVVQPRDLAGWHMTGRLATDPTHAACTMLYDLERRAWAEDWIRELGFSSLTWPEIVPCCTVLGGLTAAASAAAGIRAGTPVVMGAADSLSAVYGAGVRQSDVLCDVTGTSTCLHVLVGKAAASLSINTYPYIDPGGFCAETGLNTTGAALQWLSALLKAPLEPLLAEAATIEPGSDGLVFLPHLSGGERDDPGRTGAFTGLHLGHSGGHLMRAVLEGTAYAIRERMELLQQSGIRVSRITVCGGGARSGLWNQIKADVTGLPLTATDPYDTTAFGAAMIAARATGVNMETAGALKYGLYSPRVRYADCYASGYLTFKHRGI